MPEAGGAGVENGELLRRAAERFDVLIACDQSVPFQQSLTGLDLRVVVLAGRSNRFGDLEPLAPAVLDAVGDLEPGQLRVVSAQ